MGTDERPAAEPGGGGVKVTKADKYYEITNELTGIRIPLAQASGPKTLAPIQGIRYRDGKWTATGPNYLSKAAKTMQVSFLEQGPIKVVMQVAYTPEQPQGAYYKSTIEVRAGDPCVLFMEDGESFDVTYDFDVTEGLNPDRIRFRCHHGGSYCGPGPENEASVAGNKTFRLAVWDIWIRDGGWELVALKSTAPPTANIFGLFPGPTAPAAGAGCSGMRMITQNDGVRVRMELMHQDITGRTLTHNRFCWGMFLGLRSDMTPQPAKAEEIQEIELQRNRHCGFDLNMLHRLVLIFRSRPGSTAPFT